MTKPTQELLRSLFHYDPVTGILTYAINVRRGRAGAEAGWINLRGYRKVSIRGREYPAHVLIWVWMTGVYPTVDVDHEDRNRANNIWTNLRLATRSQNLTNQGTKFNNSSGFKGVSSRGNSHSASFRLNKGIVYLGSFSTAEEAARAYDREVVKLQGPFTRTNHSLGLLT